MLVNILENVDLRLHSTMRLGGKARYLAEAKTQEDVRELLSWAEDKDLKFIIIGQGSNIVWQDEGFDGLVVVNKVSGREILEEDENSVVVKLGSGENWDEVVEWSLGKDLTGLEFLSRIPGTVGAAPVQNIGAYGTEIASMLNEVDVYDSQKKQFVCIPKQHCGFAYRTSRFKAEDKGRYVILSVTLALKKSPPSPPFYESLQSYFDEHNIHEFTAQTVRDAVTEIRKIKLPDPSVVANNGSFFTNPFIKTEAFEELKQKYPGIKGWPTDDGQVKLSAGWLLEKAGFKGMHDEQTGMATWEGSALVLVNERAKNTADLLAFKQKITDKIREMFGVELEQEPELLP